MTRPDVTFTVLGPLAAARGDEPVPLRGGRQRAILARLLIARGRVVPVDRLAGDLWTEPPDGGVAAIRTFVADLRRALEPDRPPRQPARLLVTAPPGYVLRVTPDAVDAARFEAAVGEAGRLPAGDALAGTERALALWHGPAYAEFAAEPWARAEIDRLDELRMLAVERRAEALLALGRAAEAASDLGAHAAAHPLREEAWRLLATALYRAGRQGDALAALRRARETLARELGLDPGPALRQLEADILAQSPRLNPSPAPTEAPGVGGAAPTSAAPASAAGRAALEPAGAVGRAETAAALASVGIAGRIGEPPAPAPFFGRAEELATLARAAEGVKPRLVLISGEAGAGKTALAEELARRLAASGWSVAWGRSPEYDGAPAAWPWAQITGSLGPGELVADPAAARFRLHREIVGRLSTASLRGPLLVVLDDLHQADEGTLDALTAVFAGPEPATGQLLVAGTFRATAIPATLTAALARVARVEPIRVYLGGLPEPATAELARAAAGRDLDPRQVRLIHHRSGGNPFFVRELARLLAGEGTGDTEPDAVPAGVRDVIRHRLAQLPEPARAVLRQAAVLGRAVDPEVLAALTGDEASTLDALDRAVEAGFLSGDGPEPRFTHILVRDTLYGDLSTPRRARWHAAAGEAIEHVRPYDNAALAHHFGLAASRATAPRAAGYARAAAEDAERRADPHTAARLWRQAVDAHDRTGGADLPGRLEALMGLGRARAVTGHLDDARRLRAEAVDALATVDDPRLVADVLAGFVVPAIWTANDDEALSHRIVAAAERALPTQDGARRARLLGTLALELRGTTTDRGSRAAREAEALARAEGDPTLLAFALNARFMHAFGRTGLAAERAEIGAELVEVAAGRDLVTFEVLGHLVAMQAHAALADLAAADAHARAADDLAARYELPLVGVFTAWYAGLRLAVEGRRGEAEAAYHAAQAKLAAGGMPGMERGLLPLALLSLREPTTVEWSTWDWGPYEPWTRPLKLLAEGRPDAAAEALRSRPESPHDLLREARLCLTARAATALGDRTAMRQVYDDLLPAAGELAGAGSGVLTFGPVADVLRALAAERPTQTD
ncbi:BTAD domain-containing putative transcriptional regulator [Phytohabitans sp. LJ34]|uniref:BTAD domain-containing putative transcriptional regulator n=1 Tax=Phytohabitans sp. LJ34 TaxID=3452217 RepID=UPI003F898A89